MLGLPAFSLRVEPAALALVIRLDSAAQLETPLSA